MIRKAALFLAALLGSTHALAAPISTYQPATSPLSGTEQITGTQAGHTVNITPAQLGGYTTSGTNVTGPYTGQVAQKLSTSFSCLNIFSYLTPAQQAAVQAGTSTVDFTPIVFNAIAALSVNPLSIYNGTNIVCFPPGKYPFGSTLNLKHTVILQGSGGSGASGVAGFGTLFSFPVDTIGVVINRYNTLNDTTISPVTTGADDSIIRDIAIVSAGGTDTTKHGIMVRARGDIQNVTVSGFPGNQINIVASSGSGGAIEGNANGWSVSRSTTYGGINGLYIQGADANAGKSTLLNSGFHYGACIYDNAFIENTHDSPQCVASAQKSQVNLSGTTYHAYGGASRSQLQSTTPGTNSLVWVAQSFNPSFPTWTNGGDYYPGGAYIILSTSTLTNPYGELGYPPSYGGNHAIVFGDAESSGWSGTIAVLKNQFGGVTNDPGGFSSTSADGTINNGFSGLFPLGTTLTGSGSRTLSWQSGDLVLTNGNSGISTNFSIRFTKDSSSTAIGPNRSIFDNGYGMGASLKNVFGTGTPEAAVTANPGSLWQRSDGGARTSFYIKETGSGNTGWGAAVTGGAATSSGLTMATSRLLGRTTASAGAIEEISVGNGLSFTGGALAVAPAAAQANSTAPDIATMVTDFNALLTKLRAANLMAP